MSRQVRRGHLLTQGVTHATQTLNPAHKAAADSSKPGHYTPRGGEVASVGMARLLRTWMGTSSPQETVLSPACPGHRGELDQPLSERGKVGDQRTSGPSGGREGPHRSSGTSVGCFACPCSGWGQLDGKRKGEAMSVLSGSHPPQQVNPTASVSHC